LNSAIAKATTTPGSKPSGV